MKWNENHFCGPRCITIYTQCRHLLCVILYKNKNENCYRSNISTPITLEVSLTFKSVRFHVKENFFFRFVWYNIGFNALKTSKTFVWTIYIIMYKANTIIIKQRSVTSDIYEQIAIIFPCKSRIPIHGNRLPCRCYNK